jgi:hypothetical protein
MLSTSFEHDAVRNVSDLEVALGAVERDLSTLGLALQAGDPAAAEQAATDLHRALTNAVRRFGEAANRGGVPPTLRRRLALASGLVAAQRDAVSRATSVLDRAIDVLLPGAHATAPIYGAQGAALRSQSTGWAEA